MKLLWSYIKGQKTILLGTLVLATIHQVFSLLDPQVFRLILDRYAVRAAELTRHEFLYGVIGLLLVSVGVALVSRIAKNFQDYYVSMATQRVGAKLYADSISHSFSLPYAAFEDQRSGELLLKLQKARTDAVALIDGSVRVIFLMSVGILFVVTYAFIVHWLLGVVYFALIPIIGFAQFWLTSRIKATQKEIVQESAGLAGSTTETLRNVELVKSLGLEQSETDRLNQLNDKILGLELKKIRLIRALSFIQGTTINTTRSLLLLLMMWLIFNRTITFGEFFSLYIYLFFIFNPLGELGAVANTYQEARASLENVEQVLAMASEPKPDHPRTVPELQEIRFEDISFAYEVDEQATAREINLTINSGETVAFVGPSGSGKTTLVKLLLGLYRPSSGRLLFNNVDSSEIDFDELRRRVGYVSQDTQLFAGTIRENLLFVRPEATDAECRAALEQAAASSIIDRGEKGLDTKIGEGGIKLSGGERQRLAIARALLRNPELIIFDEATSSLDSLTEKEITETIREIASARPNLITVVIAHRLSTVAHADRIYVLEKGRIIETGAHQQLLGQSGLYAALWREQQATANGTA